MTQFYREEWTLFRSLGTLPAKAGVPLEALPRLVAKELADNALDAGGGCRVGLLEGNGLWIEDDGPGIPGTPKEIGALFSIARGLTSSKQLRLPTRGALGNGLRVVSGCVLATGGTLRVFTRGMALDLTPCEDGSTGVRPASPDNASTGDGTRIEVRFGSGLTFDYSSLQWARRAANLAQILNYKGMSSPFWYDEDAFFELCRASGDLFARALVAMLDGCSGGKAGKIAAAFHGRTAASLGRDECAALLQSARELAKPVKPERLGFIGPNASGLPRGYAKATGEFSPLSGRGTLRALIPFVVEAWAEPSQEDSVQFNVNRSPVTVEISHPRQPDKTIIGIIGANLKAPFKVGRKPLRLVVNVQAPYVPITTDGKAPDLKPMFNELEETIEKAAYRARRLVPGGTPELKPRTQIEIVRDGLDRAVAVVSGNGQSRFSLRQLFYQVRPFILRELGIEPDYNTFTSSITTIEAELGHDIRGLYRDARGTLYHPHTGEEIAIGTLSVERYKRPEWTFNKILYSEKEGLFEGLKDARWPERHDCAMVTGKGTASRAIRDVLDLLGDTAEELTFFCIHDADASGTLIYQSLQEQTKARASRRVRIVNLGLEPEEGLAMGLEVEHVKEHDSRLGVAAYVEPEWADWLQHNRIELNAMTTPQLIEWLDRKMSEQDGAKLVPPVEVLREKLGNAVEKQIRQKLTAQVLEEAGIDEMVEDEVERRADAIQAASDKIDTDTREALRAAPAQWWADYVADVGQDIAR